MGKAGAMHNVFKTVILAALKDTLNIQSITVFSCALKVSANITLLGIPPYAPEMNPIEQIWKQLRSMGVRNEVFKTSSHAVDCLCDTIYNLTNEMVKSISCRQWTVDAFLT